MTDITVKNVDVNLLRSQRDGVCDAILGLQLYKRTKPSTEQGLVDKEVDALEGVLNLLDAMLDSAEGFPVEE